MQFDWNHINLFTLLLVLLLSTMSNNHNSPRQRTGTLVNKLELIFLNQNTRTCTNGSPFVINHPSFLYQHSTHNAFVSLRITTTKHYHHRRLSFIYFFKNFFGDACAIYRRMMCLCRNRIFLRLKMFVLTFRFVLDSSISMRRINAVSFENQMVRAYGIHLSAIDYSFSKCTTHHSRP